MFNGKDLKAKREKEGLSASQLANILDTTKESVYKWENGTVPMREATVKKIEQWLKGTFVESDKVTTEPKKDDWQKKYYELLEKYTALLEKR